MAMKNLFFFSVLSLSFLMSCEVDNKVEIGKKTEMRVEPVFDAGTVNKGEKIKALFKVKNTGKSPLVISEVKGSCTCTVADFPKKPILAGQTGEIIWQFTKSGKVQFACLQPGHYDAGMKGSISVAGPKSVSPAQKGDGHGSHQH